MVAPCRSADCNGSFNDERLLLNVALTQPTDDLSKLSNGTAFKVMGVIIGVIEVSNISQNVRPGIYHLSVRPFSIAWLTCKPQECITCYLGRDRSIQVSLVASGPRSHSFWHWLYQQQTAGVSAEPSQMAVHSTVHRSRRFHNRWKMTWHQAKKVSKKR